MIETLQRSIKSMQESLTADKDKNYYENRIAKSNASISRYTDEINVLNNKLMVVMSGGCDSEIEKMYKDTREELAKKTDERTRRDALTTEKDKVNKALSKDFYESERNDMSKERRSNHYMEKEYFRYWDIVNSCPDYIAKNMKSMPNNKGYKYRGVIFYGELPSEPGPVVIFEKKYEGMYITETYRDREVVYFKPKDQPKKLLRSATLRPNPSGPAFRS